MVSRELGKTAKDVLEMKEKEGDKVVTETVCIEKVSLGTFVF